MDFDHIPDELEYRYDEKTLPRDGSETVEMPLDRVGVNIEVVDSETVRVSYLRPTNGSFTDSVGEFIEAMEGTFGGGGVSSDDFRYDPGGE